MTDKERIDILKELEKAWYKSKKFLAFLLLLSLLSGFVFCALKWQFDFGWPLATVLCVIIFTMGFTTLAFNGKQAELDKYIRGIAITGKLPFDVAEKLKGEKTDAEPS